MALNRIDALKVAEIIQHADHGCPYCVAELVEHANEVFPMYTWSMIKKDSFVIVRVKPRKEDVWSDLCKCCGNVVGGMCKQCGRCKDCGHEHTGCKGGFDG